MFSVKLLFRPRPVPLSSFALGRFSSRRGDESDGKESDAIDAYYANYHRIFDMAGNNEHRYRTSGYEAEKEFRKQSLSRALSDELTHATKDGYLNMVDIGQKPESFRTATAFSKISLSEKTFDLIKSNTMKKGDVLTVAKIAGIMAAKKTSSVIPLCHPIALTKVEVGLNLEEKDYSVEIHCTAKTLGKTGVEMEALVGATTAALTVYDMCKAVTHEMLISDVKLLKKTGGTRGDYELKE